MTCYHFTIKIHPNFFLAGLTSKKLFSYFFMFRMDVSLPYYYDHSFDTGETKIIYFFLHDGAGTNQKFDVCLPELIINRRILTTAWFVNDLCAL